MERKGRSFLKRVFAKQAASFLVAALFLGALSACGGGGDPVQGSGRESSGAETSQGGEDTDDGGVYDIVPDTEEVFVLENNNSNVGVNTSAQFYQGEPVTLAVVKSAGKADVYLYRRGEEKELLLSGLPMEVSFGRSFLDEEGGYYHIRKGWGKDPTVITKYDASGKKVYAVKREGAELQICGLPEGNIALYYRDNATGQGTLELLDGGTGTTSPVQLKKAPAQNAYLGTDGKDLFFMDTSGISRIDLTEGGTAMYLSFSGTTYSVPMGSQERGGISTFRVKGNGEAEILLERALGPFQASSLNLPLYTAILETLRKEKPDADKTILTLRGLWLNEPWMKEKIEEFNSTNGTYYVTVEINDGSVSDEDYITRTGLELGAGQGPDILYGDSIFDQSQLYSLTQKGALEELTPYMERSGIRREDYFPGAFCSFGNEGKVYGINTYIWVDMQEITQAADGSLPEGVAETDIRGFVDALLALGDQALYGAAYDSYDLLRAFLEGSDSLWGMVDWESGVCRLDKEFFPKLLQAAKNLGRDDRKSYEPVTASVLLPNLLGFDRICKPGVFGLPFDDGFYGKAWTLFSLKINANSRHKEGAWEFISYLLSRETQEEMNYIPVYKGAIAAQAKRYAQDIAYMDYRPLTEEDMATVTKFLEEEVRFLPVRNQPLVDIILDGAQDYFNGVKDISQVMDVIENRLNLYLQETTR